MTDMELLAFINKQVEVALIDGTRLRGRFCSFEPRVMGVGQYSVAAPRQLDSAPGGEKHVGIQYAELIAEIRETNDANEGNGVD